MSDEYIVIIFHLLKEKGVHNTKWMSAGAVISSHSGPSEIAITGIEKRR